MWKDPIVEELHALRAQMMQAVGGDMHRYAQQLRLSQQQRFMEQNKRAQLNKLSHSFVTTQRTIDAVH